MKYLLLDTNIYLHYKDFEQIDWATIVNDNDFAIVVPYTVFDEIDKHKDGQKGKLKNRARTISSKFGSYFLDDEYKGKINLIQIEDPTDEILETHNLHRDCNDDVIIGSALMYEHKDDVIVIANDNTLLIKAKNAGLKFLPKMPEEYLIAEEKSEEEKEYERCRKELEQLKNRQPKPEITFANGETLLRLKEPTIIDIDAQLAEIIGKIKLNNPKAIISEEEQQDYFPADIYKRILNPYKLSIYSSYNNEQLEKHNEELEKYYSYCEKFYRFKLESKLLESQLQELTFLISNTGTAETGAMSIFFDFPDEVKLYNDKSVKWMNSIELKSPFVGVGFSEYGYGLNIPLASPYGGSNIPQMESWDLTKCLSRQSINTDAESLIHNVQQSLKIKNSLYVDTKQCGNFAINWCICAAGCVKPVYGTLNVIIEH